MPEMVYLRDYNPGSFLVLTTRGRSFRLRDYSAESGPVVELERQSPGLGAEEIRALARDNGKSIIRVKQHNIKDYDYWHEQTAAINARYLSPSTVPNVSPPSRSRSGLGPESQKLVRDPVSVQLPLHAEPPPLRADLRGTYRVGNCRVTLDLIISQYENGMTPEDLVRAYDTLALADVYAAIAYYLRHRSEVVAYLKGREEEAEALRARIEAGRPRISKQELLARRAARETVDAPAGQ